MGDPVSSRPATNKTRRTGESRTTPMKENIMSNNLFTAYSNDLNVFINPFFAENGRGFPMAATIFKLLTL